MIKQTLMCSRKDKTNLHMHGLATSYTRHQMKVLSQFMRCFSVRKSFPSLYHTVDDTDTIRSVNTLCRLSN